MNAFTKMILVPEREFLSKLNPKEKVFDLDLKKILESEIPKPLKVRLINDMIQRYLSRNVKSISSTSIQTDFQNSSEKQEDEQDENLNNAEENFYDTFSNLYTDSPPVPRHHSSTIQTHEPSFIGSRAQSSDTEINSGLSTPDRYEPKSKYLKALDQSTFKKKLINQLKNRGFSFDRTGKIYDSEGKWIEHSNIDDITEYLVSKKGHSPISIPPGASQILSPDSSY